MKISKLLKSAVLAIVIGAMSTSCAPSTGPSGGDQSDFISSLISGDSWTSDHGFSHSDSSDETPRDVTITFATGEGSLVAPITVQSGYAFSEDAFERPVRAHYEFLGWYLDANYNLAVTYPFIARTDMVLYAKWAPIRHMVRFVTGTTETMSPIFVNDGDYLQEPVPPANGKSKFAGWYLDEDMTQKAYFPFIVTSSITLYAKYEIVWHTITFHTNGGASIRPLLVEDGEVIVDSFEPATHPYFTFDGWYYDDQFQNPVQYPLIVSDNLNLFAKWADTEATITFVTNGATEIEPVTVTKGSVVRSLPTPTMSTAVFLGWFLDAEFTNPVTLPFNAVEDITLYANWLAGRARLSFETNGGTPVLPIDKTIGEMVQETDIPTPTKAHYSFAGWYLDPAFEKQPAFPFTLNVSTTFYAKWDVEHYNVAFYPNGGTPVETKNLAFGSSIAKAPETTRQGYEFLGWFYDVDLTNPVSFPLTVSGNLNLFAKWKEITYSVSFNTNGAQDYPAVMKKYGEMLEENELPTPSKSRNAFLGWYRDFALTEKAIFPIEVKENITLHAKWEYITTFSVRFDPNGGSGGAYYVVENGASIEAAPEPSRPGYSFAGWCVNKECATLASFPFTVSESVTFYAKWEAVSCMLTFRSNGGTDISAVPYAYGDEISSLPTPTKQGSTFLGWYLDPEFNAPVALPMTIVEDITLYAKWHEVTYCSAYFYVDGNATEVKIEKGKALEEPAAPQKDGYTFLGWYLDQDGTVAANFPYLVTESMSFYAKWQRNEGTVTVTYQTNGGTNVPATSLSLGGTLSEPTSPVSSRGEFLGWYLDSGLTNPAAFPMEVYADLTLYAKYASYEQSYTVTFDSKGGSLVPSQVVYATGSLIAPPSAPTNPGMVFAGWYLDEEYQTAATFPMAISSDTTLYAKWDDDPGIYRVVIHDGVNPDNVYLLTPGSTLPRPSDPTRPGYVFGGWYTNQACTGMPVSFPYTPRNDMTLYAKWTLEVVEYTITWVYNNGTADQKQTVDNGTSVSGRTPSRDGYEFAGWFLDAELTQSVSFPYEVNRDVTFYAKWEKAAVNYTVSYQTNGGTAIPSSTVPEGGQLSSPTTPTKSGHIFTGWYLDSQCTQAATFPMNVDHDLVLYAGWRVDEYAAFTFEYSDALGGYVLTHYEGEDANVNIPESYNDGIHGSALVVSVGKSAFENCTSVVSIVIPDTITSIGESAFFGCTALASITIPASVTSLGQRTFYKCASLSEVNLPDTIASIGAWSFYGCSSLKTIVLPSELTAISDYLFYSSGLERIIIHSSCQSIGNFAFYNCASLTQVDIAEGCTSIGNNAFRACASLRQITIPITIKTVGTYLFVDDTFIVVYCSHASNPDGFSPTWIRMSTDPEDTTNAPVIYSYGGAYTRVGDVVYALLKDGGVSATYIGPRDVTSISLEEQVEINERLYDVTGIGTRGFRNLKSLTEIELPEKLQSIGSYAFQGCSALAAITLPSSTISIENYAFFNCSALSSVSLPDRLSTIGEFVFRGCASLKEIYVPKSVVNASHYAFSQCNDLVIMYGGSNLDLWDFSGIILLNSAGKYVFQDGIYYSLNQQGEVYAAKAENGILSATIASSVEIDGVSYSVTSIGQNAFAGQSSLEAVIMSDTIVRIESGAFRSCTNLTSVVFSKGLTTIRSEAFGDCDQLRVVELPSSLKSLEGNVFPYCANHITILVKGEEFPYQEYNLYIENNRYCSIAFDYRGKYVVVDYVVYALTGSGVVAAGNIGELHSLSIRDSVEIDGHLYPVIGVSDFAFSGMESLTALSIGENVQRIGQKAFRNASLSEVVLPESVTSVGEDAFWQGSSKKLTIYISSFSIDGTFNYDSVEHVYFGTVGPLFSYNGNEYGVTKSGGAILLSWNGDKSGVVELPGSVVDEEGVSRTLQAIGQGVFQNAGNLTKITLPIGLSAICNDAFSNCGSLEEVVYDGAGIDTIGQASFNQCYALRSASFLSGVSSIGDSAFWNCYNIETIALGNNLVRIGNYAFYACNRIHSIVLPDSLKTIGSNAFEGCTSLTVRFGSNVESIGSYAFANCNAMEATIFGSSLKTIGEGAFYGVQTVYVYVPKSVSLGVNAFSRGLICYGRDSLDDASLSILRSFGASFFLNCSGIVVDDSGVYAVFNNNEAAFVRYLGEANSFEVRSSVTFGNASFPVTSVASNAFRNQGGIRQITLPDSVVQVGSYAFANCGSLQEIVWGSGLRSIEAHAFESCANLRAVILPDGIESIGDYAFAFIDGMTVLVPLSVEIIGKSAFVSSNIFLAAEQVEGADANNLSSCSISSGVERLAHIGDFDYILFSNGSALAITYYGEGDILVMDDVVSFNEKNYTVTGLSSGLFASNVVLTQVTLPSSITAIPARLFQNCSALETIVLPDEVTFIGDYAFAECFALFTVSMGNKVASIGNYAFDNCNSLKTLELSSGLEKLGNYAFNYCSSLKSVSFGNALKSIGDHAFYYCGSLSSVALGQSVESLGESAFYQCSSLTVIILPDSLTSIGYACFEFSGLTSVTFGAGLKSISECAFSYCQSLKSISFHSSLESIERNAFYNCSSLTNIDFPTGLRHFGEYAFGACWALRKVILPNGVTTLDSHCFADMSLTYAYVPSTVVSFGDSCFMNGTIYFGAAYISNPSALSNECTRVFNCAGVAIRDGITFLLMKNGDASVIDYSGNQKAVVLEDFDFDGKHYEVTSISDGAFTNSSIVSIVLPDSLISIGKNAFRYSDHLTSVSFGSGLLSIGESAFEECGGLRSVILSQGLETIGKRAFYSYNLQCLFIPSSVTSIGDECCYNGTVYLGHATNPNPSAFGEGRTIVYDCDGLLEQNGYFYVLFNDNTARLLSYAGDESSIVLAAYIDFHDEQYALTEIGDSVFSGKAITSISLPSTLRSIGSNVFYYCGQLSSVAFNDGLLSIGENAFRECPSLRTIALPSTLTTINNYAFYSSGLRLAYLPASVTSIGQNVFTNLTLLVEAKSLVNEMAVFNCVVISDCSGSFEQNGYLFVLRNDKTAILLSYSGEETEIVLPSSVQHEGANYALTAIQNDVFYRKPIISVTIPSSVVSIGDRAFRECSSLTTVVLSEGLAAIGSEAFWYCTALRAISLPSTLKSLGDNCFYACNFSRLYVPSSVTEFGDSIAQDRQIYLGAQSIQNPNAFPNCQLRFNCAGYLEQDGFFFVLSNDGTALLTSYSGDASDIAFPSLTYRGNSYVLTEIGANVFAGRGITSVTLPSTLRIIDANAFNNCTSLTTVSLPASLTEIGESAFATCYALSSVSFGGGLTKIGAYAFQNCNQLSFINSLPETLTSIGTEAFHGTSLRSVWIPSSLMSIGSSAFSNLMVISSRSQFDESQMAGFANCTFIYSCRAIYSLNDIDFLLLESGTAEVLSYHGNAEQVVIPEEITYDARSYVTTRIRDYAFQGNNIITGVTLPSTVVEIGNSAFASCSSLRSIDLSHVQIFRAAAFSGAGLRQAFLDSVTRIEDWAFRDNYQLSVMYIGPEIAYIGESALYADSSARMTLFSVSSEGTGWNGSWSNSYWDLRLTWGCVGYQIEDSLLYYVTSAGDRLNVALLDKTLTSVTLGGTRTINGKAYTLERISDNAFQNSALEEVIFLEGVTEIGSNAFNNCVSLAKVTFTTIERIGSYAFYNCDALNEIVWGSSLERIDENAFSDCDYLTSVILPLGVQTIGYNAFAYNSSLQAIYVPQTVTSFGSQNNTKAIFLTPLPTVNWSSESAIVCNATGEYFLDGDYIYAVLKNTAGNKVVALAGYRGTDKDLVLPSTATKDGDLYQVTTIASYAFRSSAITSIILPDGLTTIKRHAFDYCDKLVRIEILSGTNIETEAFYILSKLKLVLIHDGVRMSNGSTFQFDNESNRPIFLLEGDASGWPSGWAYRWNSDIGMYNKFTIVEGTTLSTYTLDGVIYALKTDGTAVAIGAEDNVTSIQFPASFTCGEKTYSVTGIASAAFFCHLSLEEVIIPASISFVGDGAFANCYSLIRVQWSASTSSIGNMMFAGDIMLQEVTLDSSALTTLASRCFYSCSALTQIVLPAGVSYIGYDAFTSCTELAHIYSRLGEGSYISVDGSLPNGLQIEYDYQDA